MPKVSNLPIDFLNIQKFLFFSPLPLSTMDNFKEIELDEFLTIFKLPPGDSYAEKENRIKQFMAANRGQLGRLCTCGKHTCGESNQDDNSFPPLSPKTPGNPMTISTCPQTGSNPACIKFSSHIDSSPQCSPARTSTSHETTCHQRLTSLPFIIQLPRQLLQLQVDQPSEPQVHATLPADRCTPSLPFLGSPPRSRAITQVAENTGKSVPHHIVPQSREQSLPSDGTGQSTTGKASAKNLSPCIAGWISNEDEGRGVQAPNPSGPQRSEEKLQDLLRHISWETEEDTRNHERGDFEDGER